MHPFERYRLIAFDDVASCVRKSVMRDIPFEKRQFGEDIAWAKQALLAGWKIVNDPGAVVIHSHNSPVLYEFRRVFLDHQNIHDLVGLHTDAEVVDGAALLGEGVLPPDAASCGATTAGCSRQALVDAQDAALRVHAEPRPVPRREVRPLEARGPVRVVRSPDAQGDLSV